MHGIRRERRAGRPDARYLVGLQIARRLGATMSLPQMAALPASRVREVLVQGLRDMVAAEGTGAR